MPSFFAAQDGSSPIGRTIGCADPHTQGTSRFISIKDVNIGWSTHRSIITRITMSMQGNFQFLHTLGGDIYIYVFGDRVGQMTVSGLCVSANDCTAGATAGQHGLEFVLAYYKSNRISTRATPLTMLIGQSTTITGFLAGMQSTRHLSRSSWPLKR